MEKLLKEFELIGLIKDVTSGKISMSKMAEIINFKHLEKLTELRISLKLKAINSLSMESKKEALILKVNELIEFEKKKIGITGYDKDIVNAMIVQTMVVKSLIEKIL